MKATETAVDLVLDVSKNSHGNVYSEFLGKVVASMGFVNCSGLKFFRTHRSSHRKKVFCKKSVLKNFVNFTR